MTQGRAVGRHKAAEGPENKNHAISADELAASSIALTSRPRAAQFCAHPILLHLSNQTNSVEAGSRGPWCERSEK